MVEISREVPAPPDAVYRVLADGWSYGSWVVGNSRVRQVDESWPEPGSRIHHSAGVWPLRINDVTVVRSVEPERRLDLHAELWLFGSAEIRITLEPLDSGRTRVVMAEELTRGPARLVPGPLQTLALWPRNAESLRRLADIAVGREA
ncbi:SRPBCC family protein [Amycolatopsis acidiphila]|uniref:SRPBCC family protein n=1 Tax=Amycolatopsis acidiphila TaxID=715473 RepID=A0A558A705_9PSEU|nr:SRPBCC family protein [Amycolatopsis acidiphila]TVT20041.1 SRPBCC family protein [Amycolatopsis acidiphila]UIJ63505.1 SRPBCC family protein [Amycolatopsis acidiphila]